MERIQIGVIEDTTKPVYLLKHKFNGSNWTFGQIQIGDEKAILYHLRSYNIDWFEFDTGSHILLSNQYLEQTIDITDAKFECIFELYHQAYIFNDAALLYATGNAGYIDCEVGIQKDEYSKEAMNAIVEKLLTTAWDIATSINSNK